MRESGIYETLGNLRHFIPHPLPPHNPSLTLTSEIMNLYGEASFQLGQLNEMTKRLPSTYRFIKAYVTKEAMLSSAIEGIHTTLLDILTESSSGIKQNKETTLVVNYIKALDIGFDLIKNEHLPIVTRIILGTHKALLQDQGGAGEFRKQGVRVGDLIPAPAFKISSLISDLEKYINEDKSLPSLIKAGLAHVQFETIHPFLDGNGRIGRLLIVLMLINSNLLELPIIYPSYYFKKHHAEYYQRLDEVRTKGNFEDWIIYYLKAIIASSKDAHARSKDLELLEKDIINYIQTNARFNKMQESATDAINILFQKPIFSITYLSENLNKSYNTANNIIAYFIEAGIVKEDSRIAKRNKLYRFTPYIDLLEKEYNL